MVGIVQVIVLVVFLVIIGALFWVFYLGPLFVKRKPKKTVKEVGDENKALAEKLKTERLKTKLMEEQKKQRDCQTRN